MSIDCIYSEMPWDSDPGDPAQFLVMLGDCIEEMQRLPPNSVNAVITDPDYGIPSNTGAAGKAEGQGQWQGWEVPFDRSFQDYSAKWAHEALRVVKPGGHLLAFGGARTLFRIAAGIDDAGWETKDTIVWHHNQGQLLGTALRTTDAAGSMWSTRLRPTFDPITVARKPLPKRMTLVEAFETYGTGLMNIDGCRLDGKGEMPDYGDGNGKWPNNIVRFIKPNKDEIPPGVKHMATKPLKLMRWLVRLVCPKGGTVLDPFAGSGTTLEAAILEGCNGIAIERQEDWIESIYWRAERGRKELKGREVMMFEKPGVGDTIETKGGTAKILTVRPDPIIKSAWLVTLQWN